MSNIPTVSVVMITYNHEKFIEEAIGGVLSQKCDFDVELIIANDKSTDLTDQVINKYLSKVDISGHIKIEYTNHKENKGMKPNFIWALQQAKGKYIALCEGDDYWTDPLKLQKQVDFLESKPEMVFLFHGAKVLNNCIYHTFYKSKHFQDYEVVQKRYFIEKGGGGYATSSAVFKKNIIEKLPDYFLKSKVGDFPLALLAISKGEIGYIADVMCLYRAFTESSWSSNIKNNANAKKSNTLCAREVLKKFNKHTRCQYSHELDLLKRHINYNLLVADAENLNKIQKTIRLIKNVNSIGFKDVLKYLYFHF